MKRSEMVQKMTEYWLSLTSGEESYENGQELLEGVQNNMGKLLAFLEYNGMKPPVEDVCPVIWTTKHVWEPEQ